MRIPDTRPTLIARLHEAGDSAAWMEFCAIYEPTTYRIARQLGLQDADAREVSQNVLLNVSRKIARFDLTKDGRFRSWLAQIARHAAIDQLRKRHQHGIGGSDFLLRLAQVAGPVHREEELFELEARRQQFRWAAEQIRQQVSEATWQAFWLTAVEGHAGEAVSSKLGMSVGAVYVARCRTLARIRALLAPYREENP